MAALLLHGAALAFSGSALRPSASAVCVRPASGALVQPLPLVQRSGDVSMGADFKGRKEMKFYKGINDYGKEQALSAAMHRFASLPLRPLAHVVPAHLGPSPPRSPSPPSPPPPQTYRSLGPKTDAGRFASDPFAVEASGSEMEGRRAMTSAPAKVRLQPSTMYLCGGGREEVRRRRGGGA